MAGFEHITIFSAEFVTYLLRFFPYALQKTFATALDENMKSGTGVDARTRFNLFWCPQIWIESYIRNGDIMTWINFFRKISL